MNAVLVAYLLAQLYRRFYIISRMRYRLSHDHSSLDLLDGYLGWWTDIFFVHTNG
jgi:hypothetical protein